MNNKGVGARHKETKISMGVVGYLDNCIGLGFLKNAVLDDPRLLELREMGLSRHWIDIAESIGFDAFVTVWQKLSDHDESHDNRCFVYVPKFSGWLRYQRNRFILSLRATGAPYAEIQKKIKESLGEKVSISHMKRIVSDKNKVDSGDK